MEYLWAVNESNGHQRLLQYRILWVQDNGSPTRTYCIAQGRSSMLCGSLDGRGVWGRISSVQFRCHPTISSSVIPFSSCPQSFPASGSFQMSQLFPSGGQNIGASVLTSVLPKNTQDWFPLGWTGWISLLSKELSRVFSNTTVQKHQFFSAQLSL